MCRAPGPGSLGSFLKEFPLPESVYTYSLLPGFSIYNVNFIKSLAQSDIPISDLLAPPPVAPVLPPDSSPTGPIMSVGQLKLKQS